MSETSKPADDGGPAYPTIFGSRRIAEHEFEYDGPPGLSLRDWFAGQQLVAMGMWSPATLDALMHHRRAEYAYEQADAMLAARRAQVSA